MIVLPSISPADQGADYAALRPEIDAAIQRVLESGHYVLGLEVASFESEFADYVGVDHSVGVGNGTDALELALRGCGVGPGHVVYTVSHTAVATVAAIERRGAEAILVDIEPSTYTLDPSRLESAIRALGRGRPGAVAPVHLYGHPADMPAIMETAKRAGLMVVEDCAQAHGARLHGRSAGTWCDTASFSFYPTKNLGAIGDGGAVVIDDGKIAERVRAPKRDTFQAHLACAGAGTLVHYSRPVHLQPAYMGRLLRENLEQSELAAEEVLSLPIHPHLADDQIGLVAAAIPDFYRSSQCR